MFGSGILEIAIGMLFIYFMLSSICSAISEWIGGLTASRSRSLETGIRNLLNDPNGLALSQEVLDHPLIKTLESPAWFSLPAWLANKQKRSQFNRPQYISHDLFVTALLDHIAPLGPDAHVRTFDDIWKGLHAKLAALPDPQTLQAPGEVLKTKALAETYKVLLALASSANGDIDKLHAKLAGWYDEGMDRVSGWYKRKAQLVLLLIAVLVCVMVNADGVSFLLYLTHDSTARASIAAAARDFVQTPTTGPQTSDTAAERVRLLNTQLRSFSLPIGWDLSSPRRDGEDYVTKLRRPPTSCAEWRMKVLGLLFSTIAMSMGATFYFDLLKQLVNLRMSGDSPVDKKPPQGKTA